MSQHWNDASVRTRLGALAAVATVALAGTVLLGTAELQQLARGSQQLQTLNALTRTALEADMAHDAIRSDVLQGMTFPAEQAAAVAAVAEHLVGVAGALIFAYSRSACTCLISGIGEL